MFWERLHETLDTQLRFGSAYHPQIDGQTERVNQILEDMLRACALHYGRSWDKSLSYAEFSYNNSYQEILKMAPFEMLYGCRCRSPLFWSEAGERRCLDRTFCMKLRSKFIWLGRTCELRNRGKWAMPIIGEVSYPSSKRAEPKPLYVCPGYSNHTYSNNMLNWWNVLIKQSNISYIMTRGSKKDYRAENSGIKLSIVQLPHASPLERPT
jgi:hypothetical protein